MHDIATRFFGDLAGRIDGPMKIRFILQPIMAIVFAVRDGRRVVAFVLAVVPYVLLRGPANRLMTRRLPRVT